VPGVAGPWNRHWFQRVEVTNGEGAMHKVEVTSEVSYVPILLEENTLNVIKTRSFERFQELRAKVTSSLVTSLVREEMPFGPKRGCMIVGKCIISWLCIHLTLSSIISVFNYN